MDIAIDLVEKIIEEIQEAIMRGGIYPSNHPLRQKLAEELEQRLNLILKGEIDLSIVQNRMFYKGSIVGQKNPRIRQFTLNLHQKRIGKFGLIKGVEAEEIKILFDILTLNNEVVRQQDIGKFFCEKGLVHITGSKLYYKEVSPVEKEIDLEEKSIDEEYPKILKLMRDPEQINKTFSEIAKKDIDVDLKAEFINQGIEEISRLLLSRSLSDREKIVSNLSKEISQFSPSLTSRVLDSRQESSLQKKESVEDYVASIAAIVSNFSSNLKLGNDFFQESIYSLDKDNITLELLPYYHREEYEQAIVYLQERIYEFLKEKEYFKCNQIIQIFFEDSKKKDDEEKRKLSAALKKTISLERVEELLKDLGKAEKGTDEERFILDILQIWENEDFLSLAREMLEEKKRLEMFPELTVFLLSQKKGFPFYLLIPLIIKQSDLEMQKDIFFLVKNVFGEGIDAFLIAELQNDDEELRREVLRILCKRMCSEAVPILLSFLNPERIFFKDTNWEKEVIESLGAIGDERAIGKLKRVIEKKWFFFRNRRPLIKAAADALKKIASQKAIKALLEVDYGK